MSSVYAECHNIAIPRAFFIEDIWYCIINGTARFVMKYLIVDAQCWHIKNRCIKHAESQP
jgi:hypothetical protein